MPILNINTLVKSLRGTTKSLEEALLEQDYCLEDISLEIKEDINLEIVQCSVCLHWFDFNDIDEYTNCSKCAPYGLYY